MIYTLTLNPCVDYIMKADRFDLGKTNTSVSEVSYPGGKGINVSIMLSNLGVRNTTVLGFTGGYTGEFIKSSLEEKNIHTDFINLEGRTSRINVKIKQGSVETELNGKGPLISKQDLELLFKKLDKVSDGDIIVISGSVPKGLPDKLYEIICKRVSRQGASVIVDARGELLKNTLKYSPFLIKPNIHELEELFDVKITQTKEIIYFATKLKNEGALNVLVSLGGDGALFLSEDGNIFTSEAPKISLVNSVGAGDSMVAGFIYGYKAYKDYETAFKIGLASGSASAAGEWLADKDSVMKLFNEIR